MVFQCNREVAASGASAHAAAAQKASVAVLAGIETSVRRRGIVSLTLRLKRIRDRAAHYSRKRCRANR
jgi:hypothetical protein